MFKQGHKERAAVILLHESEKFPVSEAVAYDLAIVLASLARVAEARDWLAKAFTRAQEPEKVKLMALDQPELRGVWVG